MKPLALLFPLLLAGCMTSPAAPSQRNELDAVGRAAFLEAINLKRDASTTITCTGGGALGYANPQSYASNPTRVVWNSKLAVAALSNASFLAAKQVDITSGDPHNGAGNGTVGGRVLSANYQFATAGETIASGQATASAVAQDWQDSTNGHCNLMLDAGMKDVGGALVTSASGTKYWVMVIGKSQ